MAKNPTRSKRQYTIPYKWEALLEAVRTKLINPRDGNVIYWECETNDPDRERRKLSATIRYHFGKPLGFRYTFSISDGIIGIGIRPVGLKSPDGESGFSKFGSREV